MASRFLNLRRLLTSTNRSTLLGRRASVSVSSSVSSLPPRPVSAFYHTFHQPIHSERNFGSGKSFPYIYECLAYDKKHWIIIMHPPSDSSRDQIIDSYLKTLAKVVGSLEEARMKMYSVSTEDVFLFRAYISEEQAGKLYGTEGVVSVIPDVFEDDQLDQPFCFPDPHQQSKRKPRSHHVLDDIIYEDNPRGFTLSNNDPKMVKAREEVIAILKQAGLDDGAIQWMLRFSGKDAPVNTKEDAPAKKLGDCTAQPI